MEILLLIIVLLALVGIGIWLVRLDKLICKYISDDKSSRILSNIGSARDAILKSFTEHTQEVNKPKPEEKDYILIIGGKEYNFYGTYQVTTLYNFMDSSKEFLTIYNNGNEVGRFNITDSNYQIKYKDTGENSQSREFIK